MFLRISQRHHALTRVSRHARYINTSSIASLPLPEAMRNLMVHNVQSVAVVTTLMEEEAHEHGGSTPPHYHGATISSFSSVAMHPYPTIAFSLLLPSRLAHALRTSMNRHSHPPTPHIVINFLSSKQADVAMKFSRPKLYPTPFDGLSISVTEEGQPYIEGCVGSISCSVLRSFRLDFNEPQPHEKGVSELFVARVMRIQQGSTTHAPLPGTKPLVYYGREFGTVNMDNGRTSGS